MPKSDTVARQQGGNKVAKQRQTRLLRPVVHKLVGGAEMWPSVIPAGGKCLSSRGCQQRMGVVNPGVEDAYVDVAVGNGINALQEVISPLPLFLWPHGGEHCWRFFCLPQFSQTGNQLGCLLKLCSRCPDQNYG